MPVDFQTEPARYRHWRIEFEGALARLIMDVDANGGLFEGCDLKLNSYDLGVDIELADAVQRLRFEHPEVRVVVLSSGKPGVFSAGANIRMLAVASHAHKVNFCKFTNETRLAIEDASAHSGQFWLAAVSGTAAGGGYELALACAHIMLVDDHRAAVAMPEVPLLGVLPATGGLTRLTDKRQVRRDLADSFCTTEEGVRGRRALEWRLVDEIVPPSGWETAVLSRARSLALHSDRPTDAKGIRLVPLERRISENTLIYSHLEVGLDRAARRATLTVRGPQELPLDLAGVHTAGAAFWPLSVARELDDALLHLRLNEPTLGLILLRAEGDGQRALAADALLDLYRDDWLVREIRLYWRRVLSRLDLTSRSIIALIEADGFAGTLAELAFAADRAVMRATNGAVLRLSPLNFGAYPMLNGLTRLTTRFLGEPQRIAEAKARTGEPLTSEVAAGLGLVSVALDDIDWEDEVRLMLEERASFSPDALTAMEANLRFAGPETMETRIFGRLSAWQNWVFQRPNAAGETGTLKRYGSGIKPVYDPGRV